MSLVINTNIASVNGQRQLSKSSTGVANTFSRLASGLKVNSAKDDAAGLTIATRMTAQIRGINMAKKNADDGQALMQVAEGALGETIDSLQRMRDLAVQAANDTGTSADRQTMNNEVNQLLAEVTRITNQTQYNGMDLLTGAFSGKTFQIGAFSGQSVTATIAAASAGALGVSGISVSTVTAANAAITTLDTALNSVSDIRSNLGALQNRFESISVNLSTMADNITGAKSRIMDVDIAEETAKLTRNTILQQAGTAILAQANQQPQLALQLLGR